jgi:uncharacterized membrane protein (UPF0127 family)
MDRRGGLVVLAFVAVLLAGCAGVEPVDPTTSPPPTTDPGSTASSPTEDPTTVSVLAGNGTVLGSVEVRVADDYFERYTGLSDTASLGPNEGMLFVHDREAEHAYVMRDMAFPIDIVFVDADRRITAIHHAEVEERPLTKYSGRAKWVVEVPYEWTVDHGVRGGDRTRFDCCG